MSVDNIRLPDDIEQGSTGGPMWSTSVATLSNGRESRNQNWLDARYTYDISYGIDDREQFYTVLAFFNGRRGRLRAFRFKDWTDYSAANVLLGVGDGTNKSFQLVKPYADTVSSYTRTIEYPVAGSIVARIDGVPTTAYTTALGLITFTDAVPNAKEVRADFEFDVPVRFDNDTLSLSVEQWNAAAVQSITITEVRNDEDN